MELLPAYVSYSFLEELIVNSQQINLIQLDEKGINKSKAELIQLISKGLSITIDKTEDEIECIFKENPYIKKLIKDGRITTLAPKVFDELVQKKFPNDLNPFTQFFLPNFSSKVTEEIEKEKGFLIHHIDRPETYQRLSQFKIETFKKGEEKDWSFIRNHTQPHHSIIIVDPFLLSKPQNNHVVEIIKNILNEQKLVDEYHVTLFVSKKSVKKEFQDKADEKIKERIDNLKERLYHELGKIKLVFEWVFYSGEDFHDRYIITNNFMIYSGYSFDLLRKENKNVSKVKKQTSWIIVNHGKIQDVSKGTVKTHYSTVISFINQLNEWVTKKESYSSTSISNPILLSSKKS